MYDKIVSICDKNTNSMARVLCVSLYLFSLTIFVHNIKASCVDLAKVDGKDKYFPGRIIQTLKPIGFQQCLKVCGKNTKCLSINYNREHLKCELLSTTAGDDHTHLQPKTGYVYAVKDQMNVCKELQCNQTSQCLRTKVGNPVCIKDLCPRDCQGFEIAKVQANGVQEICPFDDGAPIKVQCETNGTHMWTVQASSLNNSSVLPIVSIVYQCPPGLTHDRGVSVHLDPVITSDHMVIQRRFDGSEDFYRTWADYKSGFGNASGEYWIGNDVLHALTTARNYVLSIESKAWGNEKAYAQYSEFTVADEDSDYTLSVSGYSGNYEDDMTFNDGCGFSTKDKPSYSEINEDCSEIHRSGWWYCSDIGRICTYINPNGEYNFNDAEEIPKNIFWDYFKDTRSLRTFLMKIRYN